MKLTIFNVFVPMENQEQCNRMKQLCNDNGLSCSTIYWHFNYEQNKITNSLDFGYLSGYFNLWLKPNDSISVTESEFIKLLKEYKNA